MEIWQTLIGILLLAGGIAGVWFWWPEFLAVLKGSIGIFVALVGLMFFMIGVTE